MSQHVRDTALRLEADGGTRTPDPFITSDRQASNTGHRRPPGTLRNGLTETAPDHVGQTERPQDAPRSAGERWAAMDFDATDGLSVDELGIDYGWPEPGEPCGNVDLAVQLYWPALEAA